MMQMNGVGRQFVKAAMAAPFLERDEERALAVRWREQRDDVALHKLASAHMRLVISIAARFRHYGLPAADLIQEGHVGLLEAAARFEPEREVRFSTYATWWIRASMQDYILRNWSIVRGGTSSAQKALFFNLRRLRARMTRQGQRPSVAMFAEIGKAIGVSGADVELMDTRLSGPDVSLNAPVADSDQQNAAERVDFLVDGAPLPDESVSDRSTRPAAPAGLRMRWRFCPSGSCGSCANAASSRKSRRSSSLGSRLGISKERVRQIESRAIEKLRRALEGRRPIPV